MGTEQEVAALKAEVGRLRKEAGHAYQLHDDVCHRVILAEGRLYAALAVLRDVEWSGHPTEWECPACHFDGLRTHKPDCRLAAVLATATPTTEPKPKRLADVFDATGKPPHSARCHGCGKPATCFGTYENMIGYACDDCCGHGNEDGQCEPTAAPPEPSKDERTPTTAPFEKYACGCLPEPARKWEGFCPVHLKCAVNFKDASAPPEPPTGAQLPASEVKMCPDCGGDLSRPAPAPLSVCHLKIEETTVSELTQPPFDTREPSNETTMEPDVLQDPWGFVCRWYKKSEIRHFLDRQKNRRLEEMETAVPTDVFSDDYVQWLTKQYRLAMAKGIQLVTDASKAAIEQARAEERERCARIVEEELAKYDEVTKPACSLRNALRAIRNGGKT